MNKETLFIEPLQVAAYLQARGWRQSKSFCEEKASLWLAPEEKADVDVLLPRRTTFGDYHLRIDELVEGIAEVEGRSRAEVLQDLAFVNADVLYVRLSNLDDGGSTVPYRRGVKLLRSLEDVFSAAALATLEKRAFFTNRKVERVTEYISNLRLGHTQHSSFIFTVASPLPAWPDEPREAPASSDCHCAKTAEPFERQVTQTLMKALMATKRAAELAKQDGAFEAFQSAVKDGVSANLCDAIAEVTNMSPSRDIELSMSWAASYPRPRGVPDNVVFRKESVHAIEAAGDAFWGMSKDYDTRIEGTISLLETNRGDGSATAVIVGYIGGHAQPIRAFFDGERLGELVRAYEERLPIKCEGDLIREDGRYILKNARYFEIIGSPLNL